MTDLLDALEQELRSVTRRHAEPWISKQELVELIAEVKQLRAENERLRWFEENFVHTNDYNSRCAYCDARFADYDRHLDDCEYIAHKEPTK